MVKIMLIDDREDNLITLSALLRNLIKDCQVITAASGKEGIEKIKSNMPDVILLDIMMPELDGFQVCEILKKDNQTNHIPIVLLTAVKTDVESKLKGLAIGADAFLSKPVDEMEIAAQIKVMLRIKEAQDALKEERNLLDVKVLERTKELEKLLREKEVMLREIHHRVKNNLQVISSLLKIQEGYIHEPALKNIFSESQNRIMTMSLVHEKLYLSNDLSHISFNEYLSNITSSIIQTFSRKNVNFSIKSREVHFTIDTAIPAALIVNEIFMNSLKYAFPDNCRGNIYIDLNIDDNESIYMEIGDDGIGLPEGFNFKISSTMGFQLINALCSQIHATIENKPGKGTRFILKFKPKWNNTDSETYIEEKKCKY